MEETNSSLLKKDIKRDVRDSLRYPSISENSKRYARPLYIKREICEISADLRGTYEAPLLKRSEISIYQERCTRSLLYCERDVKYMCN